MTLTGHTATSGAVGYLVYHWTGSMATGQAAAFLAHIPADLVMNEFWQWGGDPVFKCRWFEVKPDHIRLVLYEIPAVALLVLSGIYVDPMALLFGLMGNGPDLIDLVLTALGRPAFFLCHPGSKPWHVEPFFKMLSLKATAIADTILAAAYFVIIWLIK